MPKIIWVFPLTRINMNLYNYKCTRLEYISMRTLSVLKLEAGLDLLLTMGVFGDCNSLTLSKK